MIVAEMYEGLLYGEQTDVNNATPRIAVPASQESERKVMLHFELDTMLPLCDDLTNIMPNNWHELRYFNFCHHPALLGGTRL